MSTPMGQYYLLDKLAQGGMAEIYKGLAYDLHGIRRTVVIKKILPHIAAHREFIDMLVAEAKLAVQLTHGNIAQVYDLGKVGDDYFMVMEYVDGKSLSQVMRKAAQMGEVLPIPVALHIAVEAASGLYYMHSRADGSGRPLNIIHRDISPQNLMLTSGGTVKIIDFGIAKAATTIEITDVGVVKGKFAYMSPEQASGDPMDSRSDVFSLGVVLFEMLTGRRLFKGKDTHETLRNVRRANVPSPSGYRAEIPVELDEIILKSLAKSRDDRYPSAGVLRDELLQFLYRSDPGFHHSAVTNYLTHLFQEEDSEGPQELSHTPLLIIDRTQSAILDPNELAAEKKAAEESESSAATDPEASAWTAFLHTEKQQTWTIVAIVGSLCAIALLGLAYWKYRVVGSTPTVITAPEQYIGGTPKIEPPPPISLPEVPAPPPKPQTPPEPYGDIVISSDPVGAEVYLDDKPTGDTTPVTITHLHADQHHLVGLLMKGYKFWSAPVTAHPGGIERLNASLEVNFGELEILTVPAGAEVTINGKPVGKTPYFDDKIQPNQVLAIGIHLDGYLDWKQEVHSEGGHHEVLRPHLEKDPNSFPIRPRVPEPETPAPAVLPKAQ